MTLSVKKFMFWQIALLPTYAFAGLVLLVAAAVEANRHGEIWRCPTEVLGPGGRRAGPEMLTRYEYSPYPLLPISRLRVHCRAGVVRRLEMFGERPR